MEKDVGKHRDTSCERASRCKAPTDEAEFDILAEQRQLKAAPIAVAAIAAEQGTGASQCVEGVGTARMSAADLWADWHERHGTYTRANSHRLTRDGRMSGRWWHLANTSRNQCSAWEALQNGSIEFEAAVHQGSDWPESDNSESGDSDEDSECSVPGDAPGEARGGLAIIVNTIRIEYIPIF